MIAIGWLSFALFLQADGGAEGIRYTDLSRILTTIKIYPQSRCSPDGQSAFLFLQIFYKTI